MAHTPPISFPSPAPTNANGELDALNDVMFPALEEALKRRQIRLQQLYRTPSSLSHAGNNIVGGGGGVQQQQQQHPATISTNQRVAEEAHERIRKLVYKLAGVCKEIDHFDKAHPVGMGREVTSFLEGLLEEILVRVEPLEELDEGGVQV